MSLYATPAKLAEELGYDKSTVYKRIKGIKGEIGKRYGQYAVIGSRVNKAVFLDYEKYQKALKDQTQRRFVPEFDIEEAKRYVII